MSVRVSGKHMEIGESFRQKIEDQIGMAITKYFDGGYSGQVTVEKASSRYSADCKLHLDSGVVLHAAGEATDPQLAFDAASQRIEKTAAALQAQTEGPSRRKPSEWFCRGLLHGYGFRS